MHPPTVEFLNYFSGTMCIQIHYVLALQLARCGLSWVMLRIWPRIITQTTSEGG